MGGGGVEWGAGEGAEMVLEEDEESMWRDTGMSPLLLGACWLQEEVSEACACRLWKEHPGGVL